MADSSTSITLGKETLEDLAHLSRIKDQPIQELVEKFINEAIEHEEDIALAELSIKHNTRMQKQLITKTLSRNKALQN